MGILDRLFGKKKVDEEEELLIDATLGKMKSSVFAEEVRIAISKGRTLRDLLNNPLFHEAVTCDECGENVNPMGSIKTVPSPTGGWIDLQCPSCGNLWVRLR